MADLDEFFKKLKAGRGKEKHLSETQTTGLKAWNPRGFPSLVHHFVHSPGTKKDAPQSFDHGVL